MLPDGRGFFFSSTLMGNHRTWSIDFLAVDRETGELVVIELKRGQTSDATVGQVLRYMGWVRANLAEEGQQIRGIIIAAEVDDALRYALQGLPSITVHTYQVDFALQRVRV
jgi:restriction system protein